MPAHALARGEDRVEVEGPEIAITDVLPILERALFRLMTDNQLGTAVPEPSSADRSTDSN